MTSETGNELLSFYVNIGEELQISPMNHVGGKIKVLEFRVGDVK